MEAIKASIPIIMQNIKLTINYNADSNVEIQQWPLVKCNTEESDRVSVELNGMSYSLVLDKENTRVEVWDIDNNGEIEKIKAHFKLPVKS